ncbi:hypothetical protein AGABI1DRAFT_133939 [Agaricus bisporus var. burnettii JB137-S8]|uniref:Uncharacterized protein n=1 Tax=Agaricus bisporus var. burnettii (strain JB137-S8 / ATCC MYA-4627 / FGSC 10392) TaxID=597362 RepID=K5WSZ3_AGABU|nr:uncharacterized protein AGABI1DRAFT_133939 [Agaricus bisporus var. burnettii JB137-S8]EKM73873.1 hypothetical protein AGABI1DRAFT_133939 [Agaricus bisporus var. burnettii JB137-S8]
MPPSTYTVSTTRNGQEYAGRSDYPRFPQKELQRLVSRAVDLEDAVEGLPMCEGRAKRAASPTPLDIERRDHRPPAPAIDLSPAGVISPLSLADSPLTLKPAKKNGSHLRRSKKKRSHVPEARRDTVARSEPPVTSSVVYNSSTFKAQSTGYCGVDATHTYPHVDILYKAFVTRATPLSLGMVRIEALPILDDRGTVFAVFAGRPRAANYKDCCHCLYRAIDDIKNKTAFHPEQLNHRRGNYPAVNVGMMADRGLIEPTNLKVPSNVSTGVSQLSKCHEMERLLKFCDTSFQKWAPNLHAYYRQTMDKLGNHPKYRNIEGAGQGSVFGSMTVNYGSSVVTVPHRDHKNLAFGWCAVVALGDF